MNTPIDISNVVLKTERLTLRPWRQSDLEDFFEYASVDGVGQMAGWIPHASLEESQMILDRFVNGKKTFALEYQGKVIGSLGVELYKEENFPELADKQVREIGYVLSKDYWGRGLMAEAVKEVIRYLFEEVNLDLILCGHFMRNHQSARVQEKCGFRHYAYGTYETRYGTIEDDETNIITREDWEKGKMMDINKFSWTREPKNCVIEKGKIMITTLPHTDLWQRTYYHFRNDNAPVFQMETEEKYFSFIVRTSFEESHQRFDQCGIVMYLDSENWLKGSIEYENDEFQHLGSVVTNHGYSDWATMEIPATVKSMWYRLSRREDDYCIECSEDGIKFKQMRIAHMHEGNGKIRFGIYACSPEDSSFTAVFSDMKITECAWKAHDGQQPD